MRAPLWQPPPERIAQSHLAHFMGVVAEQRGAGFRDYAALHRWSVEEPATFWGSLWDFAGVVAQARGETVLRHPERMPGAVWFPDARLNFAENLLRRRDDAAALVFRGEQGGSRTLSFAELHAAVSRWTRVLTGWGVGPGDRVAGYLPNLPEAVIAMLASASLGAIWSSCSPDFGVRGVIDRFGQIEPRVLFAADGYFYGGTTWHVMDRLSEVVAALPSVEHVVVVPYTREHPPIDIALPAVLHDEAIADAAPGEIDFAHLPFDHPLYVLYSSGTTGAPKAIVHGAGGTLLQHLKEHQLHVDIRADERLFYFTTCGWMMWNWLVSGLASGATVVLYDGSPFHPDGNALFDFAAEQQIGVFGTSPRFLDAAAKQGIEPARTHDLSALRTVLSTGSPLAPESFDYVYGKVKRDVHLASISGGTDIVACFVTGCPTRPVWRGEIQCAALGMQSEVFGPDGTPVRGEKGELVCTRPFPSMPVGFWNDPDGSRYRAAYFERFPGIWHHGDFAERTEHDGFVIHGRSDAVLNPGGVRIGTAEIYRQVEQVDEVLEALVVGQEWRDDVRIVLFVRLRDGRTLDDDLIARIRSAVRQGASPRHVPAVVAQVADIPRTRSGKLVELAVRELIHGRPVSNREALENPEALDLFVDLPELEAP